MGRALLSEMIGVLTFVLVQDSGGDFESIRVKIQKIRTFYNPPFFHSQVIKAELLSL